MSDERCDGSRLDGLQIPAYARMTERYAGLMERYAGLMEGYSELSYVCAGGEPSSRDSRRRN